MFDEDPELTPVDHYGGRRAADDEAFAQPENHLRFLGTFQTSGAR